MILKTKVYWNDLNPNYAETVAIDYFFESNENLIQFVKNLDLKSFMKPIHQGW